MVKTKWTLIDWNRWDIFNNVFDIENEKRRMDSFALLWINSEKFFQWWSCYWMASSAIMWHSHKDYFKNKYTEFYNKIWTWTIWEKIWKIPIDDDGNWKEYDKILETIFSFQLSQLSSEFSELENKWIIWNLEIAKKLYNDQTTNYLLTISWYEKINTGSYVWHAVVPYRTEKYASWYRIYIYDNNVPYPLRNENWKNYIAYNQFIDVNNDWKLNLEFYKKNYIFNKMSLIKIDDMYNIWKYLTSIWFNETDRVYTLSWDSNIYLKDENWNITWYKDWEIYEQIDWAEIKVNYWVLIWTWNTNTNTNKMLYIPDSTKLDTNNLKLYIQSTKDETYTLRVWWWNYYAEFTNIETNSWDLDEFKITRKDIQVNFDKNKTW